MRSWIAYQVSPGPCGAPLQGRLLPAAGPAPARPRLPFEPSQGGATLQGTWHPASMGSLTHSGCQAVLVWVMWEGEAGSMEDCAHLPLTQS